MKKFVILSAVALFSGSMAYAQSNGDRAVTPAKVESKTAVKGETAPVDAAKQLEQVSTAIVEMEKFMKENRTREGFDQAAYENRLNILRNRKQELTAIVNKKD
jgi:hypothetical protein